MKESQEPIDYRWPTFPKNDPTLRIIIGDSLHVEESIFCTVEMLEVLIGKKLSTIENGYNCAEFAVQRSSTSKDKLSVTFLGYVSQNLNIHCQSGSQLKSLLNLEFIKLHKLTCNRMGVFWTNEMTELNNRSNIH